MTNEDQTIIRCLSLCSWCRWGITLPSCEISNAETWCSNDKFDIRIGLNNWPEKYECEEFEIDKNVTHVDIEWFKISHASSEINRLNIKISTIK